MQSFKTYLNAKTYDLNHIAKKHNVSREYLESQLEDGMKVEAEHSTHSDVAREIALDHLNEKPNYYELLKKVEN